MRGMLLVVVVMLAGCRRADRAQPQVPPPPQAKSTTETLVDGITGRTAVRAGRYAEDKIRQVSAEKDRDLEEAMGK